MSRHISTLDLHRHRYGELEGDAAVRVIAHLDDCERCQKRLGVQQIEREAFALSPTPPEIQHAAIPTVPANQRAWRGWLPVAALALAAAAAAVVALPQVAFTDPEPALVDGHRAKGTLPELELWVDRDGTPSPLREGQALTTGDQVQLLYRPRGAAWITLAGKDGSGEVEVWGAVQPVGAELQPAPFGLTLDDAPGPQVFYAVGADRPLTARDIERALDDNPDGIDVLELAIPKH